MSAIDVDEQQFSPLIDIQRLQEHSGSTADAFVTRITIEPAGRSFSDFRADVDVVASQLIHR